ncbi:MAG: MBOAT family protein [Candidatus Paceibacterota bacterium]|jgi:alginate O-acetyltransferase complex protein AlgI
MLFNSYEFLFLFLPIVFAGFFWLTRFGHSVSALWLAVASLFFYGWWSPKYVGLLLVSIALNYCIGYVIGHTRSRAQAKLFLACAITANFVFLGFFKYANFFIGTTNWLFGGTFSLIDIILPLGISFFTFTQTAFLVDVYRGVVREYNFIHYLLFVTYFPHLIAGPVLHHGQMMPQFAKRETYQLQFDNVAVGLSIFTIGLIKKVLLADNFGDYAGPVFAVSGMGIQPDFIEAWTGALAYTLQLYFDFSGYSDMAIGVSMLFGVKLPVNFNSPYKAANIIDFWRRWHMTLSQFLRDYLYIPLGGNRRGKIMRHMNLMVTMLLGGLWHGASWTFVIWGGLHGIYLVIGHAWRSLIADRVPRQGVAARIYYMAATLLTFLCVVIAWIFFRAESFSSAILVMKGCFGYGGISLPSKLGVLADSLGNLGGLLPAGITYGGVFLNIPGFGALGGIAPFARLLMLGLLIVWFAPNTQQFFDFVEYRSERAKLFNWTIAWQAKPVVGFLFGCAFCLALSKLGKVSTFLYYQF